MSFLKRRQKRLLLALVDSTADPISSRDTAFSDTQDSVEATEYMSEAGNSADDLKHTIVARYQLGNADEILAHLKMFIHGWMDENCFAGSRANLSPCTILWISFLRGATYQPSQVIVFEQLIDRVFDGAGPSEDEFALQVHLFVGDLVSHKLLYSIRKTMDRFSVRPRVASIAIIDHMVADFWLIYDLWRSTRQMEDACSVLVIGMTVAFKRWVTFLHAPTIFFVKVLVLCDFLHASKPNSNPRIFLISSSADENGRPREVLVYSYVHYNSFCLTRIDSPVRCLCKFVY